MLKNKILFDNKKLFYYFCNKPIKYYNMIEKICKIVMYTITFPHNFVIGFIEGWKNA